MVNGKWKWKWERVTLSIQEQLELRAYLFSSFVGLYFFPFLRFLFPDTCLARMMHLIRSFDFVMWEAEGRVLTARGR